MPPGLLLRPPCSDSTLGARKASPGRLVPRARPGHPAQRGRSRTHTPRPPPRRLRTGRQPSRPGLLLCHRPRRPRFSGTRGVLRVAGAARRPEVPEVPTVSATPDPVLAAEDPVAAPADPVPAGDRSGPGGSGSGPGDGGVAGRARYGCASRAGHGGARTSRRARGQWASRGEPGAIGWHVSRAGYGGCAGARDGCGDGDGRGCPAAGCSAYGPRACATRPRAGRILHRPGPAQGDRGRAGPGGVGRGSAHPGRAGRGRVG